MQKERLFAIVGSINYLIVVFLNAFSDLGHKIIIQNTIFKVYDGQMQIVLTAVVNALILLPFILVFSPSGFLADRFAKSKIMQYSALFAVFITLCIVYAYYKGLFIEAFALTFLLALQSAIYGPAKYGYIKELFGKEHISEGNAAVQAVTTVAILGGIVFYTLLFELRYTDALSSEAEILQAIAPIGWFLVIGSLIEFYLALKLPNTMQEASTRNFKLRRYLKGAYLLKNLKTIRRKREIFDAILALGIFWSISQVVLAIFGEYVKSNLGVTNTIFVQGVMALAGIGIVFGAIFAARYSLHYINMGLATVGALGITAIVASITFVESMAIFAILFALFGIFSGFIMVPLNAKIQMLSPRVHLGTILAGNNFIQTIFMFSFLCLTTLFAYYGMNATSLFYLMILLGIYLSWRLFKRYLVETFWAFMGICASFGHRYTYHGLENVPQEGSVLLLSNHVSWVDWIIIQLPFERHINFMMEKDIYYWPFFHAFFAKGNAIPVSPKASKDAFGIAYERLKSGMMVAIFPESYISKDGQIGKFYRGYEMMPTDYKGVIVPVYIDGVFGSVFAKYKSKGWRNIFKRREVNVYFGDALSMDTQHHEARNIVINMKEKYGR
ncbi:MAG: MFS transporter [Campylobacterales bacterium]|nr:MFS transporter [Campylobacterales bacterium]